MLEENADIWYLLVLCSSQWRVGMGGAYALDFGVVTRVAETIGIEIDAVFFEKLKAYEVTALKEMEKKEKEKEPGQSRAARRGTA